MRDRVLAAVSDASPRVVVGPVEGLPADVLVTSEDPPGGGPVVAAAAGLALLGPGTRTVALLAGDLPLLTKGAVRQLRRQLDPVEGNASRVDPAEEGVPHVDAVVYLDATGRRQVLCGVWRVDRLRNALASLAARKGGLTGTPVRALLDDLTVAEATWAGSGPPPWFDCDTEDDLRRAEEWAR